MQTPDFEAVENYLTPQYIKYTNQFQKDHPGQVLRITIKNTKGLSSNVLRLLDPHVQVKVLGGYDYGDVEIPLYEEFKEKTVYSRNELVKMIEEMEKIESGIQDSWSEIQKVVYVYQKIKGTINYDAKYETRDSYDIRTLRGLISKQTVCAGYSIIFKELMDRQGIQCSYVGGRVPHGGGHAWNIVEIQGKKFPIDLTWDASKHRSGYFASQNNLGQNTKEFIEKHIPDPWEPIQDYAKELSSIDKHVLSEITKQVTNEMDYENTTFRIVRDDKTQFILSQVGYMYKPEMGGIVFKYAYINIDQQGRKSSPIILYTKTNVAEYMQNKIFGGKTPEGYEDAIANVLFSKENINNSLKQGTFYIGQATKQVAEDKREMVKTPQEIEKPNDLKEMFKYPTRAFRRSDGTMFTVQQKFEEPKDIKGHKVMRYDIFEAVPRGIGGNNVTIRRNIVWSETNLFKVDDSRKQQMADIFLSRERLDRKVNETGGYIGAFTQQGEKVLNQSLIDYFETSKPIDIEYVTTSPVRMLPTLEELNELVLKYDQVQQEDPKNPGQYTYKYVDKKTGKIETDAETIQNIMFANIWLFAAGVKWVQDETVHGEHYAFQIAPSKTLYNYICKQLKDDIKNKGVIDTVKLFKDVDCLCYKHSHEILVNLFKTQEFTNFINNYFKDSEISYEDKPFKTPVALLDLRRAYDLAYQSNVNSNDNNNQPKNDLER